MNERACKWIVTVIIVIILLIVSGILFMLGTDQFASWSWNGYTISATVIGIVSVLILVAVGIEDGVSHSSREQGAKNITFKETVQSSRLAAQKLAECIARNPKTAQRVADILEKRDHPKLAKHVRELPTYTAQFGSAIGEVPEETVKALEASDSSLIKGLTRAASTFSCGKKEDPSETSPLY
jgi:hypothetical protein